MTTPATNRHGSATITLPDDTSYVIERKFDAPAALIFEAYTTPELVKRWYGFETSEWLVCEIDLRVGGAWRYVTRDTTEDGTVEVGFHGEYRAIERPTHLVSTEVFEGIPGVMEVPPDAYAVNTLTLEERDSVTTMTVHVQHANQEDRDMVLATGMEGGMQISYNRLEDLVTTPTP